MLAPLGFPKEVPSQTSGVLGGRIRKIDFVLQIARISSTINPVVIA